MLTKGYSLLEVLLAISVMLIVCGLAVPLATAGVDRTRAHAAASYVAGRIAQARFEAVKRSTSVGLNFVETSDGYSLRTYVDGNGNGVLTQDIVRGLDRSITSEERLDYHFPGVTFGIQPNVTSLDPGEPFNAADPIQIGGSTLMSFSPNGSSTSGTLFVCGRRFSQFAVRVLGATGRARVFQFNFENQQWQRR